MSESTVLVGSPYSLPSDADDELLKLAADTQAIRSAVATAASRAAGQGLLESFRQDQGYREVYESNALEFEGPDLANTVAALRSDLATDMDRTLSGDILPSLLAEDADLHAVIGLEAARQHSSRLLSSDGLRPLTETDIRTLHELITRGHDFSGQYKRYHVLLGGHTKHEPVLPIEVPFHMGRLVGWNSSCEPDNPILRAAALHAWMTHIHPFEDGNGRVARLLANLTLARAGLPPAIVKARTQRTDYLDALAVSDEGGDIMPLTGLFTKTLVRYAREMEKPRFVRKLFHDLIESRGDSIHEWFTRQLDDFLRQLAGQLAPFKIDCYVGDSVDRQAFEAYRTGERTETTTVRLIQSEAGAQIAVLVGAPSSGVTRFTEVSDMWPSIQFAIRNERYRLNPYDVVGARQLSRMREIYFDPDEPKAFAWVEDRLLHGNVAKIAEIAADRIRVALRTKAVTEIDRLFYRTPVVDGGQG
jgi:Fic family protein